MASGGLGVAKYLKRSMDRSSAFVKRQILKPDSYKSNPKQKKKRKLSLHSDRQQGIPSKEITLTTVFRSYLLVSILSLLVFPFINPLFRTVFMCLPNGGKLLSIFEFTIACYFGFIAGSACFLLFFYLFRNLWGVWINNPVEIDQEMKEVKLHIVHKQKKRRFRKPAFLITKKDSGKIIPGKP